MLIWFAPIFLIGLLFKINFKKEKPSEETEKEQEYSDGFNEDEIVDVNH
jgi:hypothetical protein